MDPNERSAVQMKRIHTDWGHLEAAVLAVVAAQGEAVTVTQVQAQLSGDPAYTTVMSTLSRLARKGALSRTLSGRAYRYELAAPEGAIDDAVTARQMRDLMSSGGHPDAVLARFVADLEPADTENGPGPIDRAIGPAHLAEAMQLRRAINRS